MGIAGSMPSADGWFRLYMAEMSYFSMKVRPAFRWKHVPCLELLATSDAYRRVIQPRIGFPMIPVVVTPENETWQDSSDILDGLERRFPDVPLYPTTPVQRLVGYLVELYADEFLMLPGLHWRWSFPESEAKARAEFAASLGESGRSNRFADAIKNFTGMLGINAETIPAVEAHTRDLLAVLDAHLAGQPYVLGGHPSLADCALMGPLYAHLYQDAVPARLLRETAPRTCHWIERMNRHPDPDVAGTWLAGDALAPTLRPLLELIGRDGAPFVLDTVRAFEAWTDATPPLPGELPRLVGMHRSVLRGVPYERVTLSYSLWMLQRVQDAYAALDASGRAAVDRAIAGTGCEALFAYTPHRRVSRRPFKLFLDS